MSIQITGKFVPFGGGTFALLDLSSLDPTSSGGAANRLATNDGTTPAWAQLTNPFVAVGAAIAVAKLAAGAANTVLTSNGVTNAFAQITNAFVATGAAIDGQKILPRFGTQTGVFGSTASAPENTGAAVSVGDGLGTGAMLAARAHSNTATAVAVAATRRSRGTEGAPTAVVQGDAIGELGFAGYDGTNYQRYAKLTVSVDAAVAGTTVPLALSFYTGTTVATLQGSISSAGLWNIVGSLSIGTGTMPASGALRLPAASSIKYTSTSGAGGTVTGLNFDTTPGIMVVGENNALVPTLQVRAGTTINMFAGSTSVAAVTAGSFRVDVNLIQFVSSISTDCTIKIGSPTVAGTTTAKALTLAGGSITGDGTGTLTAGKVKMIGGQAAQSGGTGTAIGGDVVIDTQIGVSGGTNKYGNLSFAGENATWQTMQRGFWFGNVSVAPTGAPTAGFFMWGSGGVRAEETAAGNIAIWDLTTSNAATAGLAGALPALPAEYIQLTYNGNVRKVAAYAA